MSIPDDNGMNADYETCEGMSLEQFERSIPLFQALGDPVRQRIVLTLGRSGPLNVKQLTEQSHLSRPAISHHLKILRQAGLVSVKEIGTVNLYTLEIADFVNQMKGLLAAIEAECTPGTGM
ncbi:ArsR/SmtB family transcription factor [Paenibacillus sp. MBLB4367]|uniref:ArsR/SmtB family transcription factor n=1 Tax=Paenibacillus sp. MBLB4367 TaxID=3384767 RepID=UPI0039083FC1